MNDARLAEAGLDPQAELARFLAQLDGEGAVVSFIGLARPTSRSGSAVELIFLDHHPRLTERSLQEIAGAAAKRFAVGAVSIVHRVGEIAPREPILFVAAAAAHRRAAFEAADYLMDRLKTDAFFWKREDAVDGVRWIEPGEQDRAAGARWDEPCRD